MAKKAVEFSTRDAATLNRMDKAFRAKGNLDRFWQQVAENHHPLRADFTSVRNDEELTSKLYSNEPILFREEFGDFLGSVLRPKGRYWFGMLPREPRLQKITRIKSFLDIKRDMIRGLLYDRRAGYTRAQTTADHDYVTFGNSVGTIERRKDRRGILFNTWHLRDNAWLVKEGTVDTNFRKFKAPVRELCAKERENGWSLSPKIEALREKEMDREINCAHVVMPYLDYDWNDKTVKMDYVSLYYDTDHRHLMSAKPVPENPYFVDRWRTIDNCSYGFSPCVLASLPDARTLQVLTWSIMEASEKAVEPPIIATHEAILGGVNIAAAAVTWVDRNYDEKTGEAIRALELGGAPETGERLFEKFANNLRAAWRLNKLFMPQTYDKTAYEAQRLWEEFLRSSQPIIEPAEAERNGNHLELTFAISLNMGLWGNMEEMPQELRGQDIDFAYDNPFEDAQKQASAFAFKSAAELAGIAAQLGKQEVIEQVDWAKGFRESVAGVAPPAWLKDEDESEKVVDEAEDQKLATGAMAEVAGVAQAQAAMMPKGQPAPV